MLVKRATAGRVGPAPEKRQNPDRGIEGKALWLILETGDRGAAAPGRTGVGHSRTWLPARGGQLAATPGRPRSTASVRTNEFTVACNARKRSSTDASTYKPPVVHASSSKVRVTSSPRQKPPLRAPGPLNPGMRAVPGRDVTLSRARIALRDSVELAAIVETQHLAQGVGRGFAADDAEMPEGQMRDQPPETAFAHRHAKRRCRRRQAGDADHGGGAFDESERRTPAAERQGGRQVAVAAQRVDRQNAAARALGVESGVVRQQVDLGAAKVAGGFAARGAVEAAAFVSRSHRRVPSRQTMERLPCPELAIRKALAHALDGPYFQAGGTAHVRLDAVLDAGVIERDRLAALRKEVDDGRAAESEAVRLHGALEVRHGPIKVDEHVHPVARRDEGLGVEPAYVDELELLARGEILAEQAKAGERPRRPREQRLFRREADGLQRFRRQDHRMGIRKIVGQGDRDGVGHQQLEQPRPVLATEEEAQPVEAELR